MADSDAQAQGNADRFSGLDPAAIAYLAAHCQHQAQNALCSTLELAGGPLLGDDLQRAARAPSMVGSSR